eukprot:g17321.t1
MWPASSNSAGVHLSHLEEINKCVDAEVADTVLLS